MKATARKLMQRVKLRRVDFEMKQIDGKDAFSTITEATTAAADMGCSGYRSVEEDGRVWYLPCGEDQTAPDSTDFVEDGVHMVSIKGALYDLCIESGEPKWIGRIRRIEKA